MPVGLNEDIMAATRRVRDLHAAAEAAMLERLARAVARGSDTGWIGDQLRERQLLLRDLDRLLADLAQRVPGAIAEANRYAYGLGAAAATADVPSAYRTPGARRMPAADPAAVLARAQHDTSQMRFQVRRHVADVYDEATQHAAAYVVTGASTRREAAARLLTRLTEKGVTGFVDRAGRRWEMAAYAEMATRASAMNAALQGHTDRLQGYGLDTIVISDHAEECPVCRPWEGKVLSISGETQGTLSDGRKVQGTLAQARAAGVFHPGCRHTTSAYIPGFTRVPRRTADPEGDALRQEQRARERDIRRRKRRVISAEAGGKDSPLARRERERLRAARADFATWRNTHGRKNLAYRESLKVR